MKRIFRRATIIIKHIFFEENILTNIKKHLELVKVLKPFKKFKLISANTYSIYLFSYISRSLKVKIKLQTLIHHYSFLKNHFSVNQLYKLFKGGIECYRECNDEDQFTIILTTSGFLEIEGSLSLFLKVNNINVACLSFTFVPGKIYGVADDNVVYISCLQRNGKQPQNIVKAKKHFNDIAPAALLLKSLEAISETLHIQKWLGVSAKDQLSYNDEREYEKYHAVYDEFWKVAGGELINGNYVIPCPLPQKDILLIKQTHRNRARRKRQKLNQVYADCYCNMINALSDSNAYHYIKKYQSVYVPYFDTDARSLHNLIKKSL